MSQSNKTTNDLKLVRPSQVCELLGISIPTLYRYLKDDPDFPPRVRLGKNGAVAFRESDIRNYIERNTESKAEAV